MPLFTSEYVFSDDYPTIEPSLKLDFANARALDPRITFTRASTATYVGANGLIKTAGVDEARFDHDPSTGESLGLLIEESRTNLVTYSEQFDNAVYSNPASGNTITANTITAPDGTTSADLVSNVGQGVSLVEYVATVSASSTTDYYATIYAKKGTASYFTFNCYYNGNTEDNVSFNFDTGVVSNVPYTGEYIFQNVGNGWYRCGFRMTRDSTGIRTQLRFRFWESGRGLTSGNTYFWGAQLEAGAFPTSYIPTSGSTATRSKDDALITGGSFESWINKNEGTWLIDFRTLGSGSGLLSISATGGSVNERYMMLNIATDGIVSAAVVDGGVLQTNESIFFTPTQTAQFTKAIFAVKDNDFAITANGLTPVTDTSGTVYNSPTQLRFAYGNGSSTPYAHFKTCIYYPKRLTNAQLQTLTQ
jgi:hypothetical protein